MGKLMLLGVCGSPRKGNSDFLLGEAMRSAEQVTPGRLSQEYYTVRGKNIGPCIACSRCIEKLAGECSIQDDFQELRDKWLAADIIIYSVPVYHMGIPGQLKCFIDRLGNSNFGRYMKHFPEGEEKLPKLFKTIGIIAQGIHIHSGQEHTITDLINHALIMQCIPVTGDLWQSYIGCGGWTTGDGGRKALEKQYNDGLFDAKIAVQSARDVGRRATEVAIIFGSGISKNLAMLKKDPVYSLLLDK